MVTFLRYEVSKTGTLLAMPLVRIYVTLKPALLDSAGKAVQDSLAKLGFAEVEQARIGKLIELHVSQYEEAKITQMCDRLLANPVIEDYRFEVVP